jgi:hypothetical protein
MPPEWETSWHSLSANRGGKSEDRINRHVRDAHWSGPGATEPEAHGVFSAPRQRCSSRGCPAAERALPRTMPRTAAERSLGRSKCARRYSSGRLFWPWPGETVGGASQLVPGQCTVGHFHCNHRPSPMTRLPHPVRINPIGPLRQHARDHSG